jgi:hypothetical protein
LNEPSSSSKSEKRFFFNFQMINAMIARAPIPPATDRPMIVDEDTPPPLEGGGGAVVAEEVGAERVLELVVVGVVVMVTSTGFCDGVDVGVGVEVGVEVGVGVLLGEDKEGVEDEEGGVEEGVDVGVALGVGVVLVGVSVGVEDEVGVAEGEGVDEANEIVGAVSAEEPPKSCRPTCLP